MISSLGLIEVVGLVGAVEAGDTAVKAASVRLLGYELTKGGGMVTVKIEGEVSAVKAAVDAAVMAAEKLTTVVSHLVIARPSEEVAKMIESTEEQCECSCESKETEVSEAAEEKIVAENIVEEKIEDEILVDNNTEVLSSPLQGTMVPLSSLKDDAFAQEIMGKGIAIDPTEGKLFAPCDGTVMTVFPTKHAIGLVSEKGSEILIHMGMDTVRLDGKYFDTVVEQGQKVKKGDLLATFDIEKIHEAGYSLETPVIITNTKDYSDIVAKGEKTTNVGDELLTLMV